MSLKSDNRKAVLDFLRSGKESTIADIEDETRISKTTLKKILEYFIKTDLVSYAGKGSSTDEGGKKPDLFILNRKYGYVISICITMHDIFSAITDMSNQIVRTDSVPIKKNEPLDKIINHISSITKRYIHLSEEDKERLLGLAIGFPGIADAGRGIGLLAPNYPSWGINIPIKERLLEILNIDCPIYLENVNRFQAIAEKEIGIAKGYSSFMIIEGGYGFGGAIFDSENTRRGSNFLAGEVGHMVVDPKSGKQCSCGAMGCLNALVRVEDVIEKAAKGAGLHPESVLFKDQAPENLVIEDIFSASNVGDPFAVELMDEVIDWFAIGISNSYAVYDPDLIVLQGVFTGAGDYFLNELRRKSENMVLKRMKKDFRIEYSPLGTEREVVGGATLVLRDYFEKENLYSD